MNLYEVCTVLTTKIKNKVHSTLHKVLVRKCHLPLFKKMNRLVFEKTFTHFNECESWLTEGIPLLLGSLCQWDSH